MAAGIEIRNASGTILVDENYFNLVLRTKSTIGFSSSNGYSSFAQISVSSASFPVIAWECASLVAMTHFTKSGSTYTFHFACQGGNGTSCTFYVFGEPSLTENYGKAGFEVFNAAGQRVFHSGAKPARVEAFVAASSAQTPISYLAGRRYATSMLRHSYSQVAVQTSPGPPFPPPAEIRTFYNGVGGGVGSVKRGNWQAGYRGPSQFGNDNLYVQNDNAFMVLDVTGF